MTPAISLAAWALGEARACVYVGWWAVRNFARSGARFLLTTTFENFDNVDDDSKTDAFYANNLAKAPFNFPRPLKCKRSHPPEFDEHDLL
mmetsp:Transcript_76402/g.247317  ORF Transcript_76402/g.247317 Transcript_76402/m.247317 type:complete len:90 (-) Transcript_76402:271-540(-)